MDLQRGLVRGYNATNHTADILLPGSLSRQVMNVTVAQHIGPELMVEGADCAVAFFADGSSGIVVATFGAPPPPHLYAYEDTGSDLVLTTSWQTIPDLSITVTPTTDKTWRTIVLARVTLRSVSISESVDLFAQIALNGTRVGYQAFTDVYSNWTGSHAPLYYSENVASTAPSTYTIQAKKGGGSYGKTATQSHMLVLAIPDK